MSVPTDQFRLTAADRLLLGRIDWPRVILNLRGAGCTHAMIAEVIGVTDTTVCNHVNRDHAKFKNPLTNVRLLDMHLDVCPEKHTREELYL